MLLLAGEKASRHCGAKSHGKEWDGCMGAQVESLDGPSEAWAELVLPEVWSLGFSKTALHRQRKTSGKETGKETEILEEVLTEA